MCAQVYRVSSVTYRAFFQIAQLHYYFNVSSRKGCRDNKRFFRNFGFVKKHIFIRCARISVLKKYEKFLGFFIKCARIFVFERIYI